MISPTCRATSRIGRALGALAILLPLLSGCAGEAPQAARDSRPNVVFILVDALRPDRLGCYGYERPTSPTLDGLASKGAVLTDVMAQAAETMVSVPALLTGRYPREHGLVWLRESGEVLVGAELRVPTIAEILRDNGYDTAAVSANPLISPESGVAKGFDTFDHSCGLPSVWRRTTAAEVNERAYPLLEGWGSARRPFFLYLHYMDPHNAYRPPSAFCVFGRPGYTARDDEINAVTNDMVEREGTVGLTDERLAERKLTRRDIARLSDLYDGEVLCADHYLGELLGRLKQLGLYDNTIIIITADHGEAFLEHESVKHGGTLYQEAVRVPLIIAGPGIRPGRRITGLVELNDLAPTILAAAGVETGIEMSGRNMLPALTGRAHLEARPAMAELPAHGAHALRVGDLKLISSPDRIELYDLSQDPREVVDLAGAHPETVAHLRQLLDETLAEHPAAPPLLGSATDREKDALRSLGYLK